MKIKRQTKSRYRLKQEAGLVPYRYDRDSARHHQGAWRHWPEDRLSRIARGFEKLDRETLQRGREARECLS